MKRTFLTLALLSLWSVALMTPAADAWGGGGSGTAPWCRIFGHHNYTTQINLSALQRIHADLLGQPGVRWAAARSRAPWRAGACRSNMGAPPWCNNYGMGGMPCMSPGFGGACGPDGCCASDMRWRRRCTRCRIMRPSCSAALCDADAGCPDGPHAVPFAAPGPNTAPFTAPDAEPSRSGWVGHCRRAAPPGRCRGACHPGELQSNYYPAAYPGYYPQMPAPMGYYRSRAGRNSRCLITGTLWAADRSEVHERDIESS